MNTIEDFNTYQDLAMKTLKDMGSKEKQLEYAVLAMCGETGELANLLKKKFYHNKSDITINDFIDEASDVLWYLTCVADALDVKLSEIAYLNIDKLKKRYNEGKYNESHYVKTTEND